MAGPSSKNSDTKPAKSPSSSENILSFKPPPSKVDLHRLGRWHVELLCALDTIGLKNAKAPTYEDFADGGGLTARLYHLCALCEVTLAPDAPAPTRMHLWLKLTKHYLNAIQAYIGDAALYEQHYRPKLTSQEHQFVAALSIKQPGRGLLFQALLPLAIQDDLFSRTAKVITWAEIQRSAIGPSSRSENT